jgi:CheY-like chemotaxis protein
MPEVRARGKRAEFETFKTGCRKPKSNARFLHIFSTLTSFPGSLKVRNNPRSGTVSHLPAVLCIDDNVLGLAVRKAMLESRDYKVFTAENGPKGLEIASREEIDLVILDYQMPEMDGGQVAERLRNSCSHLPILLLSGFPGRIPRSLLASVDGFVLKGSSPEVLLKEVERITRATGSKAALPPPGRRRRREPSQACRRSLRARQKRKP